MKRRGEEIIDQLPMMTLSLERFARDIQLAVTYVTDVYRAFRTAIGLYPTEVRPSR